MGRPLSVFWLCLLAVSVGCVCYLCLLAALVGAVPFYLSAVPVGCACWPCLLSVPLVRARGGGTPGSTGAAIPRVAHQGAARADPPSGAANATTARPHSNAPRGQILLRVPQTRRPPDHTPTHRAGRSSGSAVPNLIEQGCDAHHDMRTPAPLGHPALFGCASVCPCFALRHQLRRRLRFTPKSSGRNSQHGSTSAPGSHAQ